VKIGLYNSCLLEWDLDRFMSWATQNFYSAVELHGGPRFRYVDWDAVATGQINPVADCQARYPVRVSGIMFGALNFLSADSSVREAAFARLEVLLRAAKRSGIPLVSTFTGRNPDLRLEQNLERGADHLRRIADLAEKYQVDVAFENCPMFHEWPWVHNIAISPAMWRALFEVMGSPRVGLNFDPSHLVWQGIDYLAAVDAFIDRIKIVQAKDTELLEGVQRDEGMLSLRWWRHRIPGEGMIDWPVFVERLRRAGYDGVLSIEHEDPVYEGDEARVLQGLSRTRAHLDPLL
jgi:sugar phosphate isomerase/epimerase